MIPSWTIENGRITDITCYPIELGMAKSRAQRGVPRLSRDDDTLQYLKQLSESYGTKMTIKDSTARIVL